MTSFHLNSLPKSLSPTLITSGVRGSTCEFRGTQFSSRLYTVKGGAVWVVNVHTGEEPQRRRFETAHRLLTVLSNKYKKKCSTESGKTKIK